VNRLRRLWAGAALSLVVAASLGACDDGTSVALPPPQEPTREAGGYYCGMIVVDHEGPKGQIFLTGREDPLWFSSVRDAIAFTMLPEEPKRIRAVYVNDMARAKTWAKPEPGAWVLLGEAWYVIESDRTGGMGAPEAVPFSDRSAAEDFAAAQGGHVVAFADIPPSYILGGVEAAYGEPASQQEGHGDH